MTRFITIFVLLITFFCGGCGVVSVLSTPTRHEKKVPAEFQLKNRKGEKMLVFVENAVASGAGFNITDNLSGKTSVFLIKKTRMDTENLISYDKLSKLRAERNDFSQLSPAQVGSLLQTDMVLYVLVENYELYATPQGRYYNGSLATRSLLFDTASGNVLWPKDSTGRVERTAFELESKGRKAAVDRLAMANAHCITRYFYDCPKAGFRIADEQIKPLTVE